MILENAGNRYKPLLVAAMAIILLPAQLTVVDAFTEDTPEPVNTTPQNLDVYQVAEECLSRAPHPPILIEGDAAFGLPGNGITNGSGTESDPYVIQGWCITAHAWPVGTGGVCTGIPPVEDTCVRFPLIAGIRFLNTTAHVVVRNNVLVPTQGPIMDQIFEHKSGLPPSQYGISFRGVQNVTLENNLITHNQWDGISLTESDHNAIKNNTVMISRNGINLRSSNHNAIEGNVVHNMSSNGIFVFGGYERGATGPSDYNIIKDNIVRTTLKDGITLFTAKYNLLDNNTVSNAHGIHNTYSECPYERCRKGISLMVYADHNVVTNNLVTDNGKGIGVTQSSDNLFNGNIVRDSATYGIWTPNKSERNQFHNNTIVGNWLQGLWISPFRDNVVRNNTITHNGGVGIEFFEGGEGGLVIKGNNIHDNGWLPYARWGQALRSSGVTFLQDPAGPQEISVDISGNWWGNATGPSGDIIDACTGSPLSGDGAMVRNLDDKLQICVSPWLDAPNQQAGSG